MFTITNVCRIQFQNHNTHEASERNTLIIGKIYVSHV